jgi:FkbM family methyltransferase
MQPQLKKKTTPNKPPIDTIVHLGAGRCSELNDYLAQRPRRLLLVEADPQLADDLQNRTKDRESVQVSCAAIAGQPGPATFNRYNLPEVNSLHAANKLIELFPGLKTVEQLKVNAISPDSLLSLLKLNAEQENLLIIDLPGEELPVLQVLKQSQKLHLFSQMILHCGCEPLYEGSEPAEQVLEWLRNEGFDLVAEDNSINPDRPCWTLRRNDLQLRNHELQEQVEQLAYKNQELKNDAAALQGQVEALTSELDVQKKQAKERETQIGQLKKAGDQQARLAAGREQQLEELRRDRDKQTNLANMRQLKISELSQSHDEQMKLAKERHARINELTKALDEVTKTQTDHKKWNESQKTQLEKLEREKKQLQQQLQDVKQKDEQSIKIVEDRKQRVEQLEQQLAEKSYRQQLLDEELNKAEVQIEMIKDVLIRENF